MLRAMNQVMQLQWPIVKSEPRLTTAWRQGERYWRDYFGRATVKQLGAHLRRGELQRAASAGGALIRYVRSRLFIWPWIFRKRAVEYARRRWGTQPRTDARPASSVVSR